MLFDYGSFVMLSVIIPTLNEVATICSLINSLRAQQRVSLQIIVSDGGSTDNTVNLAATAGSTVVRSTRGRGQQMNSGAKTAVHDYLLFLHADSVIDSPTLLHDALAAIKQNASYHGDERTAGHFQLRFVRRLPGQDLAYRRMEAKTALNRPYTTNGDQGLLISRRFFEHLGGFDESLPFLEDQRIAERIRTEGRWITLPGTLMTSARRFETEGFRRRYILMALIMGLNYAELPEFFRRAPDVYRAQHEIDTLLLTPYFRLITSIMAIKPLRERLKIWIRVGRFVRQNLWQGFFGLDVWLAGDRSSQNRCLAFYDRVIAPLIANPVGDTVTAGLTFIWAMGVLRPWFRWRERRWL